MEGSRDDLFSIIAAILAVAAIAYLVVALVEAGAILIAPDAVTIWLGVPQFATLAPLLALLYRPLGD